MITLNTIKFKWFLLALVVNHYKAPSAHMNKMRFDLCMSYMGNFNSKVRISSLFTKLGFNTFEIRYILKNAIAKYNLFNDDVFMK